MCLAVPGIVLDLRADGDLRMGRVDFGGVRREVCLDFVPEARPGDRVLVHAGFALRVLDPDAADLLRAARDGRGAP